MTLPAALQFDGVDRLARFEHAAMATSFVLHLRGRDEADTSVLRAAAAEAFRLVDRLEEILSLYREGSDVSRINRAAPGETLHVHEATMGCLLTALEVAAASDGAFDPFAGAEALAAKGQPVPAHLRDVAAGDPAGTPCVAVDPEGCTITRLEGRRWLDLGAVGKGFALDAVAELLPQWDVEAGLLVAGGSSVVGFGRGPHEGAWLVRLLSPEGERTLPLAAPFGLAASGEGFQPGHIVRNRASHEPPPARAYALAPSGALADALSTAAWALDAEARARLARQWPEAGFLIEPTRDTRQPVQKAETTGVFATTTATAPDCLLVVPCWRESRRLPRFLPSLCEAIGAAPARIEILVVDDGSEPAEAAATSSAIEALRRQHPHLRPLARLASHEGKGAAIRHGWRLAPPECPWLAFVDADGSVPARDVARLLLRAVQSPAADRLWAASRRHRDPAYPVKRTRTRSVVGAAFAAWSRRRLRHHAADPQCGCKVVPAEWLRQTPLRENGYMLDLELLVAARRSGLPVENVAVAWHETPGSKLRVTDLFSMLQRIERLRITAPASSAPLASSTD